MSYETREAVEAAPAEMRREMDDLRRRVSDLEQATVTVRHAAKVTDLG